MYTLNHSPAILDTIKVAVGFFNDLKSGRSGAWDRFACDEVLPIKELWSQAVPDDEANEIVAPTADNGLTPIQLRSLGRAMTVYIAAHDGRYSLLLDFMSKSLLRHPGAYTMRSLLAVAEGVREMARPSLNGLPASTEHEFRALAVCISDAFNSPGQAMTPDLSDMGIQYREEKELPRRQADSSLDDTSMF